MYSSSSGVVSPPGLPPPPPPKPGEGRSQPVGYQPTSPQQSQQQYYPLHQQQQPPPPNVPPTPPHPSQTQTPTQQYVRSPPPLPPQGTPHLQPPPPPPSSNSQQQPIQPWLPPTISTHTTTDLTSLLSNPTLLASLSTQHPSYSSSLYPLLTLLAQTTALAHSTLHLQSQLTTHRAATAQLLLQHTSLQSQWRHKQRDMDAALDPWGPRAIYQRLTAGIAEQEQLVRAVTESFMDAGAEGERSEREVAEWIKRVREGAGVLEKRREMKARWDEGRVGGWR